jgi:hypothetical protein
MSLSGGDRSVSKGGRMSRSDLQRHGDLELVEDLPFQRREWLAERVAWSVMALVVGAAILGLFGSGPLSRSIAGDEAGPLWLEYERFVRLLAPADLKVHLGPGAAAQPTVRVWIDRRYMESAELKQVTPQPVGMEAGAERLILTFRRVDGDRSTAITFNMRPSRSGSLSGRVGLIDGPTVRFDQFVYP